jgi:hypothetical protein
MKKPTVRHGKLGSRGVSVRITLPEKLPLAMHFLIGEVFHVVDFVGANHSGILI